MKNKKMVIIVGTIIVIFSLIIGINLLKADSAQDLSGEYEFMRVEKMDLSETIDATGSVLALEKKDLYADYEGSVDKIHVKAGDQVKKGEILLTITSSVLKEQWREADSALKQAEINLALASGQLATELGLNKISEQNLLQVENHTHQVALYREQVEQAKQRLSALNAKNDGYYMADNEKLFIRAPFAGQVAWVHVGQGEKITTQSLLATVVKPDVLGVEAQIDENDISQIKVGQEVVIVGNDQEEKVNAGIVAEIGTLGQKVDEIIFFPIRIKLTDTPQGLLPGMTVDVTVTTNEKADVLGVPAGSVTSQNNQDYVGVHKNGEILQIPVEIGLNQGKFWEVKSGLKDGDEVAVPKPEFMSQGNSGPGFGMRIRR